MVKEKLRNGLVKIRRNWRVPAKGNYVPTKEIFWFSLGGMGVKSVNSLITYIQLAPTCLLVASVYGLSPTHIMWLFIAGSVIGFIKTPFTSMLIDITNTKIGKFRPYLLWAGIPSLIAVIGLTWLIPVNGSIWTKIILIGIFINILSIAQPLHYNAYTGISQTISPNSGERTKILSISEFFAGLGPSIVQFLLPTLAGIFFGKDGMINIWSYRIFMPILMLLGFLLGLTVMNNTQERVIKPKEEKNKIKFWRAAKEISGNKYFWIVTMAKFFDGFKGIFSLLLAWICAYQLGNSSLQGVIITIASIGFTPGLILTPLIMSKLGSRKGAFCVHICNAAAALIMLFTFKSGVVFFVAMLIIYNFTLAPQYIMQTSILSDGLDYHQDKKGGLRLEGFAHNFMLMITMFGGILSTVIFTAIYNAYGLRADGETGLTDYSVLADASVREPIITGLIIVVIGACILSAIPYLFYDLTPEKLKTVKSSLEKKKFLADNGLTELSETEAETVFTAYLAEKEEKDRIADEKIAAGNAAAKEKDDALKAEKLRQTAEKEEIRARLLSEGKSGAEIGNELKKYERAVKEKEAADGRKIREELRAEKNAYNENKRVFVSAWIAEAKKNGEKHYLKILAREAFNAKITEKTKE